MNYLKALEIDKKPEDVQVAQLLHLIGEEGFKIFNTFTFKKKNDENILNKVLEKFDDHFTTKLNTTYERYQFFTIRQEKNESIENFITRLKSKAATCEFKTLENSLVRDMLVVGLDDEVIKEKLLQEKNLKLEEAIEITKTFEKARQQVQNMKPTEGEEINEIKKKEKYHKKNSPTKSSHNKQMQKHIIKNCTRCGRDHARNACSAYGKECLKCKKMNHFAHMCKSKINTIDVDVSELSIDEVSGDTNVEWSEVIKINNKNVNFKLDTGAVVNLINLDLFNQIKNKETIVQTNIKLKSYTNDSINLVGKTNLRCNNKNLEFFVVKDKLHSLLGLDACIKLNLIKKINAVLIENNYKDVFRGIGCIEQPQTIELKENSEGKIHPPRRVPLSLINELKEHLNELEKNKIINKVNKPTDWVNPLVLVRKPDGKLRVCLDPRDLNEAIKRKHFPIPTLEEITNKLNNSKIFTTLDAASGFHQIKLDEKSSDLCTFATPFGRYRFLRMPYGIKCAPEMFHETYKKIFNLENVEIYIDDILIHASTVEEHDKILKRVLEIARKHNIKFNINKCKFRKNKVKYMGHVISKEGIYPDQEKVKTIKKMESPKDKKALQRFLGMVTYLTKFIKNLSALTAPLRELLKKDRIFQWDENSEKVFQEIKNIIVDDVCLKFFNVNEVTTLSVDSSKDGLGATLIQEGKPCAYASKALTDTEKRYAQIEKELLAICFGVNKFHNYIYGKKFIIETDHKPLINIQKKLLNDCPARLQRMLLKLQKYDFELKFKPGKELIIADTLSRAYIKEFDKSFEMDLKAQVCLVSSNLNITKEKLKLLQKYTSEDEELSQLKTLCTNWPSNIKLIPLNLRKYYKFKNELVVQNDLVYKNQKVIIPKKMQKEILNKIHLGHQGINKCKMIANNSVYWFGINKHIEDLVANCEICIRNSRNNQKEPLKNHEIIEIPWYKVGMDLFQFKNDQYLILVDYYSKFIELINLKSDTTSRNIIYHLKQIFSRQGIPKILMSDNGPQFVAEEFKIFSKNWEFIHINSSPRYPQSNGQVERTIQTVKNVMKKTLEEGNDEYLALLMLRNTPIYDNKEYTPSLLLNSRVLRDTLPIKENKLKSKLVNKKVFSEIIKNSQNKQKKYYDKNKKYLKPLKKGEKVYVRINPQEKNKNKQMLKGIIINKNKQRYKIKLENNKVICRNRVYIKSFKEQIVNKNVNESNYKDCKSRSGRLVRKPVKLDL